MKWLLLLAIKLYWALVPASSRRKCIFKLSCSRYVYQVTASKGLYQGLQALKFRFMNCRGGFHLFNNPVNGCRHMILPGGTLIGEDEIAGRFLNNDTAMLDNPVAD